MKVRWSKKATHKLLNTADYIANEFGYSLASAFLNEAIERAKMLESFPELGPLEEALEHKPERFHYLTVGKKNKIIYRIKSNHIDVVDFWDVRLNPQTLIAGV